jgi:DnaJ-like protein
VERVRVGSLSQSAVLVEARTMDILAKIAEQRIREAMERGEFDNLPFHGKPIKLDDLVGVPEHLRMGYKVLKNAGVLPEEMQLKKEIVSLKDLLDACYDETEKQTLQQKMNAKVLRYNMMLEKQLHKPTYQKYHAKILKKLGS